MPIYENAEGILYPNAHNGEEAIALVERAEDALICDPSQIMRLDHPLLRTEMEIIAYTHNMGVA